MSTIHRHLVLLHGATGSSKQFAALMNFITTDVTVHAISFEGHGGVPGTDAFSIPQFAAQVVEYIDQQINYPTGHNTKVYLFGYSMGGFVALYLARFYPGKVEKVITLGTKFRWTPEIADRELSRMDPEKIIEKVPVYAAALEAEHAPLDWKAVLNSTSALIRNLAEDNVLEDADYATITTTCLLLVGDRDKLVGIDETLGVFQLMKHAQFGVLPGTGHAIDTVDTILLSFFINLFIRE